MRPLSGAWTHFKKYSDGEGKSCASCNYCGQEYKYPNITRLKRHLIESCLGCPLDIKQKLSGTDASHEEAEEDLLLLEQLPKPQQGQGPFAPSQPSQQNSGPSPPKKLKSQPIKAYLDSCSDSDKQQLDQALARAVYASSVSLSLFNNPYWQAFFKLIRPSYKPPTGYMLGNPLLDAEYSRVMEASKAKIDAANCLGILSDGWKNIRGEALVNFIIATPAPVFFKSIVPGENKETGEYIAEEICKVIQEVGPQKVLVVQTDNAANMRKAWRLITAIYPHILTLGCVPHGLNLLLADILKLLSVKELFESGKKVACVVRNRSVVLAAFQKKQEENYKAKKVTIKIPKTVRWYAVVILLWSELQNKKALQETVLIEDLHIEDGVRSIVLDLSFWSNVTSLLEIMKPVSDAILILEADDALLSDVYKQFTSMEDTVFSAVEAATFLSASEKVKIKDVFKARKKFCVKGTHMAAYLVDPRYAGVGLTEDEVSLAIDVIVKQSEHLQLSSGAVVGNLASYRTKTGFYEKPVIWDAATFTSPAVWWSGLCKCKDQPLSPIASRLLSIPPSSAGCERNWSVHRRIHSKSRNKLLNKRVEKLVAVQSNLRMLSGVQARKRKGLGATCLSSSSCDSNVETDDNDLADDFDESDEEDDDLSLSHSDHEESDDGDDELALSALRDKLRLIA